MGGHRLDSRVRNMRHLRQRWQVGQCPETRPWWGGHGPQAQRFPT
jgi:hypothetical protein